MISQKRSSNIELLRFLAAVSVIIVHYIYPHAVTGIKEAAMGGASLYLTSVIEAIAAPAVNVFILISGFFLCSKKSIDISKPITLLIQLILFKELLNIVLYVLPYTQMSIGKFVKDLMPVSYFVVLYIAMYILSPYINLVINKLEKKELRLFIIILSIILCIYPFSWDVFNEITGLNISSVSTIGHWGNQCGHTIAHFIYMYCIGAYLRLSSDFQNTSARTYLVYFIATIIMSVLMYIEFNRGIPIAESAVFTYINPLIILQSVCLLLMFKNLKIQSAVINWLASLGFITYIICGKVYTILFIDFYTHQTYPILLLHLTITLVVTFIIAILLKVFYTYFLGSAIDRLKKQLFYYN